MVDDNLRVRRRILLKASNSVESVSRDFRAGILDLGVRVPEIRPESTFQAVNLALS
jgi:hypothetical protein